MKSKEKVVFVAERKKIRNPSATVKCDFCDFTCAKRGMNSHLRVKHSQRVTETIAPVIKNAKGEEQRVIKHTVVKGVPITIIETTQKVINTYHPICYHCAAPITSDGKEIWETIHGTYKGVKTPLVFKGDFVCDKHEKKLKYDLKKGFDIGDFELRPLKSSAIYLAKDKEQATSR